MSSADRARDLPPASSSSQPPAEGHRGVKSERRARPCSVDAIFLETIVQVYFFWVVQFWRFAIWLARE